MKRLIIGLVALSSVSAFANCDISVLRVTRGEEITADLINGLEM